MPYVREARLASTEILALYSLPRLYLSVRMDVMIAGSVLYRSHCLVGLPGRGWLLVHD